MNKKQIAVYYEHPEWFRPLFAELEKREISFEKINAANDFYNPNEMKNYALVFNRMSASAYLRGHGGAIFYTRGFLASLEQKGVRVINGYEAFQIEISKALQAALFDSLGVKYPATRVINSAEKAIEAAKDLQFPVIVKPNIGGRGAGIIKFETAKDLKAAVENNLIDLGIDSTALVQEFAPKRGGSIQRIETLGGKFLYGLKIFPEGENFNLCPAEVCQIEDAKQTIGISAVGEMCLADAPKTGLRIEAFEPPPEIIETVERIVAKAKIDVGGVEYLIDDKTGDTLFYDINALSNFVADAPNLIGFDPHEKLVDFLEQEIEKCATDIGCRSSAVG
ncbi:MAG: ATP-grasp domain-containing protein [Pyrinomonadaceae bacterium]